MDAKVFDWRRKRLEDVGLNFDQAVRLAATPSCDLHTAEHLLVDLHCPAELAFDILSEEPE
jgi:hypothetical protein